MLFLAPVTSATPVRRTIHALRLLRSDTCAVDGPREDDVAKENKYQERLKLKHASQRNGVRRIGKGSMGCGERKRENERKTDTQLATWKLRCRELFVERGWRKRRS